MATPHVAGAAAILAQQHPQWTGPQLKAALMASAKPNPALDRSTNFDTSTVIHAAWTFRSAEVAKDKW